MKSSDLRFCHQGHYHRQYQKVYIGKLHKRKIEDMIEDVEIPVELTTTRVTNRNGYGSKIDAAIYSFKNIFSIPPHRFLKRLYGISPRLPCVGIIEEPSDGLLFKHFNPNKPFTDRLNQIYDVSVALEFIIGRIQPEEFTFDPYSFYVQKKEGKEIIKLRYIDMNKITFSCRNMFDCLRMNRIRRFAKMYRSPDSTEKAKVFSFSMFAYAILFQRELLFGGEGFRYSNSRFRMRFDETIRPPHSEKEIKLLRDNGVGDWIFDLIKSCWAHKEEERPNFEEIVRIMESNGVKGTTVGNEMELLDMKERTKFLISGYSKFTIVTHEYNSFNRIDCIKLFVILH